MAKVTLWGCVLGGLLVTSLPFSIGSFPARDFGAPERLRQPVALVLADEGKLAFVANRRAGSIAILDLEKRQLISERNIGKSLADLALTPDGRFLLAVDEEANELILLSRLEASLEIRHRVSLSQTPVSVRINSDGSRCAVASLWARRLTLIDLSCCDQAPRITKTIALPFAPRLQLFVGEKVIVADSFGGQLAVVGSARGTLDSVRTLPAHNIRGLGLSTDGKELLLTHQHLTPYAHTTREDIHWGNVIANKFRVLSLESVLVSDADLLRSSRLFDLGDVGEGAGDPAGLAVRGDGTVIVALAGTGEVAVGVPNRGAWTRLRVGQRPTAVALHADSNQVLVANTNSFSVSVLDLNDRKVSADIELGARPDLSAAQRGELLFHDARLTHGSWFSCQSCHTDGHSNGLRADTLGDGSFGAPKRVLSLLGVKDTGPWAWNGSSPTLRQQIQKSMQTTMYGPQPTEAQIRDLEAYLGTLVPPPGPAGDEGAVRRGRAVFEQRHCNRCHEPPFYTTPRSYDVGLVDEMDNRTFNPPSLRGLSQSGPFFHDSRAITLEEVLTRYRHELKEALSHQERQDLLAFLLSL